MNIPQEKVAKFMAKYGMSMSFGELDENCSCFLDEMQKGLDSADSSLMMIPAYISADREILANVPVIVVDAGGTNFRIALVYFDNTKKPVIEDFRQYSMPGSKSEITKEEFFDTIAGFLEPFVHKSSRIAICFSYPAEILPDRDGRIIEFCKEVKVRNAENELLGENINKALKLRGFVEEKSIVVLNDTAATLLGGKAAFGGRIFESYIGFILGTGTNTCYIERNCNINKIPSFARTSGSMLINVESGKYNKIIRGAIDTEFDKSTITPGGHAFEKLIGGAYQGGLLLAILHKACTEGLFTPAFVKKVSALRALDSKEIDDFLYYPYKGNVLADYCSSGKGDADRLVLFHIIDAVFERIAMLVTINLTAVMLKSGKAANPCAPVCITADGSTFYKSKLFKTKLEYYMKAFACEKKGLYYEFVRVDNGNLIGSAIAALLN